MIIEFFNILFADVKRHIHIDGREHNTLAGYVYILLCAFGLHCIIIYRYGKLIESLFARKWLIPIFWLSNLFYKLANWITQKMYGIRICREAKIGKGFYIGHFGGIYIASCVIGTNCSIHQHSKVFENARIGNNVWIGAHAEIMKGVNVQDYGTIMVAAKVYKTVYSRCLASGNPARIINKNYDNSSLLSLSEDTR